MKIKGKTPIIAIDNALNRYEGKVLFPKKLEKANKMLLKIGIDKIKSQPVKGLYLSCLTA